MSIENSRFLQSISLIQRGRLLSKLTIFTEVQGAIHHERARDNSLSLPPATKEQNAILRQGMFYFW